MDANSTTASISETVISYNYYFFIFFKIIRFVITNLCFYEDNGYIEKVEFCCLIKSQTCP